MRFFTSSYASVIDWFLHFRWRVSNQHILASIRNQFIDHIVLRSDDVRESVCDALAEAGQVTIFVFEWRE